MLATTHVAAGAYVGALYGLLVSDQLDVLALSIGASCLASLAPDIDHPESWLGRRIPIVSVPVSIAFGHRGVTHSLWMVVFLTALVCGTCAAFDVHSSLLPHFLVAGALGYISHLLGDWATNSGIPLLWPRKTKYRSPVRFFTGGSEEHIFALLFWSMTVVLLVFST